MVIRMSINECLLFAVLYHILHFVLLWHFSSLPPSFPPLPPPSLPFPAPSCAIPFLSNSVAPSAPPSNFSVTNLGYTYVQLFWDPPPSEFQNGAITSYMLKCQSSIPVPTPTFNGTYQNGSFTARGGVMTNITVLFPGIMYMCSVLATNGAGDSPPAMINVTTIEQRK